MKVLVIDDAQVMRNIHTNMLREHSVAPDDIYEAGDGVEAFVIAKRENIDLFLVDWNMPRLNGLEFVKKIRVLEKYSKTPIIMVTSEAAKYNVMEAIQSGVTNYIVKPIKWNILWEKISKYIEINK